MSVELQHLEVSRGLDLAGTNMNRKNFLPSSKLNEIRQLLEGKDATKTTKKKELDPSVLRERLLIKQDEGIVHARYDFREMSDQRVIDVNNEIERNARIMNKVHTYKLILGAIWTIADYVMSMYISEMSVSYLEIQMTYMKDYEKHLYRYAESLVEAEDQMEEGEVEEESPLNKIIDSSWKIGLLVVVLNLIAQKWGSAGANMIKPIAKNFMTWFVQDADGGPLDSNNILKESVDSVSDILSLGTDLSKPEAVPEARVDKGAHFKEGLKTGGPPPFS